MNTYGIQYAHPLGTEVWELELRHGGFRKKWNYQNTITLAASLPAQMSKLRNGVTFFLKKSIYHAYMSA